MLSGFFCLIKHINTFHKIASCFQHFSECAFSVLACKLLWLEIKIHGPQIQYMPLECFAVKAVRRIFICWPSHYYCPIRERVRGLCYINKNVLQQDFTRGCTRDSSASVRLFVQVAWHLTRGLQWLRNIRNRVRNFISSESSSWKAHKT